MQHDPIEHMEHIVREVHDTAGKYTQPVLRRYPLTFLFLLAFSAAAFFEGFKMLIEKISYFDAHPATLMGIGVVLLFGTGMLYKTLGEKDPT